MEVLNSEIKILHVPQEETEVQYTKKGTVRKRKPKTKKMYFTQDTEDAIIEYLAETDPIKRNRIYNERIDYGFHKLTENIIHTFKFYYTEVETIAELQHEVTAFLLEKLHLYNQSKGKAFSYFGTIAKRYLILYNNKNYEKLKGKADVEAIDEDKTIVLNIVNNSEGLDEPLMGETYFMDKFIQYMDLYLFRVFPEHEDAKTADAVMQLFRHRENLDIFNKKGIYIYIREQTDQDTPQITKVMKKLEKVYRRLLNQYLDYGFVSLNY
jgi:hypothetical protein